MPVKIQNPDLPRGNRLVRNWSESKPAKAQQKVGSPSFSLFDCFRLDFYYNDYNYIHRSISQGGWSPDFYTYYLSICLWFRHMQPTPIFCLVTVHVLCFMARCDGCTGLSTLGVNFFLCFLFSCFNSMSFIISNPMRRVQTLQPMFWFKAWAQSVLTRLALGFLNSN